MDTIDSHHISTDADIALIRQPFPFCCTEELWRPVEGAAQDFPDPPLFNHLLDFQQGRTHTGLQADQGLDPLLLGQRQHLLCLVGIFRQRPLAEDVFTSLHYRHEGVVMLVDADRAHNKVDVWISGKIGRGSIGFSSRRKAMSDNGCFGRIEGGVAEGDDLVFGSVL